MIPEQTAIISLNDINRLMVVMVMGWVFLKCLNCVKTSVGFREFNKFKIVLFFDHVTGIRCYEIRDQYYLASENKLLLI